MKPSSTPGMNVRTLWIVLAFEKSGPGMAARRTQAAWRAKAVLMMRTSKALGSMASAIWSGLSQYVAGVDGEDLPQSHERERKPQ